MKIQNAIAGMMSVLGLVAVASTANAAVPVTTLGTDTLITSVTYNNVPGNTSGGVTKFTADIYSAVYETTAGTLDFVYQFKTVGGPSTVKAFSTIDFTGFTTSLFNDTTTADQFYTGPYVAAGSAFNDGAGTIDYFYTPPGDVPTGDASYLMIVKTNATAFTGGSTNLQDGGNLSVPTFAPTTAPVPEPTTIASFGFGGFGLLGLMVRARKARKTVA